VRKRQYSSAFAPNIGDEKAKIAVSISKYRGGKGREVTRVSKYRGGKGTTTYI
jgi:hypothetical protein